MNYVRKLDVKCIIITVILVAVSVVATIFICGGFSKTALRDAYSEHKRSIEERETIFKEFRDGVQGVADELSTNEVLFRESDSQFEDIFGYLSALGGIFDQVGEEIERLRGLLEQYRSTTP